MTVVEWYDLGTALGLSTQLLKNIEKYSNNEDNSRIILFKKWLEENDNPTWSNISNALNTIGQKYLAEEILKKYSGMSYIM